MTIKKYITPLLVIILLAIVGVAWYYYDKSNTLVASTSQNSESDAAEIVEKVGQLIKLPSDETPTIATVSDLEKLKDQPFFAKAKVGDKVLMYPKSKKAYLYDAENNKILEVAPIDLEPQENSIPEPVVEVKSTTTKPR